jgi:hypothetical protein
VFAAAFIASLWLGPPATAEATVPPPPAAAPARRDSKLRRYLSRPVMFSPRYLDHGVIGVAAAGGWPHLYRLELQIGLLDHLTVGATAHWLPSQDKPGWSPKVAIAFWRGRQFEVGAHYFQSMYQPPVRDADPETLSFQKRVHWFLGAASISQRFISAGFDAGVIYTLDRDESVEVPEGEFYTPSHWRTIFAGGLHLRAGTRRWGFTANLLAPRLYAEIAFDVRFGAFEVRPRGGWREPEVVYSVDRRVPPWR